MTTSLPSTDVIWQVTTVLVATKIHYLPSLLLKNVTQPILDYENNRAGKLSNASNA